MYTECITSRHRIGIILDAVLPAAYVDFRVDAGILGECTNVIHREIEAHTLDYFCFQWQIVAQTDILDFQECTVFEEVVAYREISVGPDILVVRKSYLEPVVGILSGNTRSISVVEVDSVVNVEINPTGQGHTERQVLVTEIVGPSGNNRRNVIAEVFFVLGGSLVGGNGFSVDILNAEILAGIVRVGSKPCVLVQEERSYLDADFEPMHILRVDVAAFQIGVFSLDLCDGCLVVREVERGRVVPILRSDDFSAYLEFESGVVEGADILVHRAMDVRRLRDRCVMDEVDYFSFVKIQFSEHVGSYCAWMWRSDVCMRLRQTDSGW